VNDESVKRNAEFVSDSGVKAYIIRTTTGKCCEWCTNIAGKYEYGQEPKDIYRRHANCDCVVEYVTDGKSQNVHTKKWKDNEAIQERKGIEPSKPSEEEKEKLKSFIMETNEEEFYKIRDRLKKFPHECEFPRDNKPTLTSEEIRFLGKYEKEHNLKF